MKTYYYKQEKNSEDSEKEMWNLIRRFINSPSPLSQGDLLFIALQRIEKIYFTNEYKRIQIFINLTYEIQSYNPTVYEPLYSCNIITGPDSQLNDAVGYSHSSRIEAILYSTAGFIKENNLIK